MSEIVLEPVHRDSAHDDDLIHDWCDCRGPDVALCGIDLADAEWVDEYYEDDLCVVCADLAKIPCPCDQEAS